MFSTKVFYWRQCPQAFQTGNLEKENQFTILKSPPLFFSFLLIYAFFVFFHLQFIFLIFVSYICIINFSGLILSVNLDDKTILSVNVSAYYRKLLHTHTQLWHMKKEKSFVCFSQNSIVPTLKQAFLWSPLYDKLCIADTLLNKIGLGKSRW